MIPRLGLLVLVAFAGLGSAFAITGGASSAVDAPASFVYRGTVTKVVDGDTLMVKMSGKAERVRLIGIDAPEMTGECYASQAKSAAQRLAQGKRVRLLGDRGQVRRDRFGRLLAYVILPSGRDLGGQLIAGGFGKVFVARFARLPSYRAFESSAKRKPVGVWANCGTYVPPSETIKTPTTTSTTALPPPTALPTTTAPLPPLPTTTAPATTTTTPPPAANCHPSYPTVCIPPSPPDLDCPQIPHRRFAVRHDVLDPDPHRFDGDRDGVGCEV